jgi:hypothetical protein
MSVYDTLDPTVIKKAGDYLLSDIFLVSYQSKDGSNTPDKISIETMVIEMNIYESIYNKTLSGNLIILDATGLIAKMPLTGNERLSFKFFTPSSNSGYDFTIETGNPVYIYKVQARQELNARTQVYVLHFCSKEMITNEQVKIDNAQTGSLSNDIVASVVKDSLFLNSPKPYLFEPSLGVTKFLFTKQKPFDAIDSISKLTQSLKFKNAGYYFYETSHGFNYRSIEHMLATTPDTARAEVAAYRPKPSNIRATPGGEKNVINEMQVVMGYSITDEFDTLKNLRNGVYASKLITHNQLDKTITETVFDYRLDYPLHQHTESGANGQRIDGKGILPVILREGKYITDNADGTIYLLTSTTNAYDNNIEKPDSTQIVQQRLSQRLALQSFKLQMTLNGFTGVQAGDVITFDMPSYSPKDDVEPLDRDPYMSGRYLVTSIRHRLDKLKKKHIMSLECMKDSVSRPFPSNPYIDVFANQEKSFSGDSGKVNLYDIDVGAELITTSGEGFLF